MQNNLRDMSKFQAIVEDIRRINKLEPKKLEHKIMKFNEEFGECNAEFIKLLGYTYKPYDRENLVDEMADSLQCLLAIFADIEEKIDISITEDILPAVLEKNKKWESKIPEYKQ